MGASSMRALPISIVSYSTRQIQRRRYYAICKLFLTQKVKTKGYCIVWKPIYYFMKWRGRKRHTTANKIVLCEVFLTIHLRYESESSALIS